MIDARHTGKLYLGRVAIRDKFVKEALKNRVPLRILHDHNYMIIQPYDIEFLQKGKSAKPVADQFSAEKHYLIYFVWKPSVKFKQAPMFKED